MNQKKLLPYLLCCLFFFNSNAQDTIVKDSSFNLLNELVQSTPLPSNEDVKQALTKKLSDFYIHFKDKNLRSLTKVYKSPVSIGEVSLNYNGIFDSSYIRSNKEYSTGQFDLHMQGSLLGIPVIVNYKDRQWDEVNIINRFISNINFDKESYLNTLKKELGTTLDLKQYDGVLADPFAFIKQHAEISLRSELNKINRIYANELSAQIADFGTFNELVENDITHIRQKLLNKDFLTALAGYEQVITELQQKMQLGELVDTALYMKASKFIQKANGMKKLVDKLEEHIEKWERSGLIAKIKGWDVQKRQKIMSFLNDPATIINMARKNLSLNSLQKAFLKINRLSIGQNTISNTPLSMSHFLNNGFMSEFAGKSKAVMVFFGKQPVTSSINNLSFNNTGLNVKSVKTLRLTRKKDDAMQSQISIMSFDQALNGIAGAVGLNAFSQAIVTTLDREFLIGGNGRITAEVSKSITNYNLKANSSADAGRQGLEELLNTGHILDNSAFKLRYEDEYPQMNLAYSIHLDKTANGYTNPGNSFLNQGSKEGGLSVRKSFLKRKLQLSLRTDIREYQYGDKKSSRWRSAYGMIDMRWRMNRGQSLSLRYLPNQMVRIEGRSRAIVSSYDRLSIDANLTRKISTSLYYSHFSSLAYQHNNYYQNNKNMVNENMTLLSNQSFIINKRMLFLNTQFNYAMNKSDVVYFNSYMNADIGSSYTLFHKISATTSLSYAGVQKWYEQIGVRQTMNGQLNEHIRISFFIDARKNISVYQPQLYGPLRAEFSFQYSFKNK